MVWTGNSNPVPSVPQQDITCDNYAVAATSTLITLLAASSNIVIQGDPNVTTYVNLRGGACTASNFAIPAGGAFQYVGAALLMFTMLSATGTANVGIQAN